MEFNHLPPECTANDVPALTLSALGQGNQLIGMLEKPPSANEHISFKDKDPRKINRKMPSDTKPPKKKNSNNCRGLMLDYPLRTCMSRLEKQTKKYQDMSIEVQAG